MENYKKEIYRNYLSVHVNRMHGNSSVNPTYKIFKQWDNYYLPILKNLDKNVSILEIGCGNGMFVTYLKERGYVNVRGIDISDEYLSEGFNRGEKDIFKKDIFEELHDVESYGLIIAIDVLEHFSKSENYEIFKLIHRKLAFNGYFLFQVPNGHGLFFNHIYYSDITHETVFSCDIVNQICGIVGFRSVNVFASGPRLVGLKGYIRVILWKIITVFAQLCRFLETGLWKSFFSQNIIVYAVK